MSLKLLSPNVMTKMHKIQFRLRSTTTPPSRILGKHKVMEKEEGKGKRKWKGKLREEGEPCPRPHAW